MFQLPPIPESFQLRPTLELRERFERRTDRDFAPEIEDNRSDALTRVLVGLELKTSTQRFVMRYRYADDLAWTHQRNFSESRSDLDLGYAVLGGTKARWTLGRQKLSKGQQRLLSQVEWSNVGISWDGARYLSGPWDVFAARLAFHPVPSKEASIAGVALAETSGETMVIFNHDRRNGLARDLITLDRTHEVSWQGFIWTAEAAVQTGRTEGRNLDAWAAHLRATRTLIQRLSAYAEANAASGGSSVRNTATFDNLYPANHYKYGLINMQGWRNMQEFAAGLEWTPLPKVTVNAEYHRTWLMNATDAWYSSTGPANRFANGVYRDPTGASGRSLGHEWDLFGNYRPSEERLYLTGISVFLPGRFVGSFHPTGTRPQVWLTFAATFRF